MRGWGDKEYYYQHASEIVDYENNISSSSNAVSNCDLKGKLVPADEGEGMVTINKPQRKMKVENPLLDQLKKDIALAKKTEGRGLSLLPQLVVFKRGLNQEGREVCETAEENFLKEAKALADLYEKAEGALKDDSANIEEVKGNLAGGIITFKEKIDGLKSLKADLQKTYAQKRRSR